MKIEQIYTGCLAQGAYYIESEGEAVVIDPLREVAPYISKATAGNAQIKYVFETHFHADFVSGHLDLAEKTGAKIVYGPNAAPKFDAIIAKDGDHFQVGKISFELLHTPGHTMESSSFLLKDETGKPVALFSGDTLFIGDVGRPDLAQKFANKTKEELASILYHSLRNKIMPLPDDVIIYPAHGAGSACGKNISRETTDTLGNQKATNYALRADMTEAEFVKELTEGLPTPPGYFPFNVLMNKEGYDSLETVIERGSQALTPDAFEAAANETNALMLDTRDPQIFAQGFIPNSINIGIDGNFAPWVGALIPDIQQPILVISDEGREEEVITRLARVGYDNTIGFLKGGFASWQTAGKETDHIDSIAAATAATQLEQKDITVLDVRRPGEYKLGHITEALNTPLDDINQEIASLDKQKEYYVHCAGGYRSMIFLSILRSRGFEHVTDIQGGFKSIREAGKFSLTTGEPAENQ
ncbi:MBL fold metallo-hydrolase [Pseudoflavitalea sp. G-6-1-2]|uniref:MBL fold metallo-hydrolase n=1 Tax=Pseudoflavitalea sp. G-6-1-2 TaxID=2728841 RepID=UPI00146CEA32|nr:MBL fold metallo-hydrolase [Pseudoflavitalea sp. G-6-1-2]NML19567.1 MBL fold metallo-hydrolase [Pseudoflavitalea sp. G-6-1-2]